MQMLRLKSCQVATQAVNVAEEDRVEQVHRDVSKSFGRLGYVANAAGIAMKHQGGTTFAEIKD
jgi:hypothetical protein